MSVLAMLRVTRSSCRSPLALSGTISHPWGPPSSPSPLKRRAIPRWKSTTASQPRTALFFPGKSVRSTQLDPADPSEGQGVQRVGMAAAWLSAFPRTCKPFLEEMDHILCVALSRIIAEGPHSLLTTTVNAQPAIMAVSIMVLRVLEQEFDFKTAEKVDVTLGHSLGEFASLIAGGYLEYKEGLLLVHKRAEAMARCTREASIANKGTEYGMVALVCEPGRLESLISTIQSFLGSASSTPGHDGQDGSPIEQVLIANINSKNQIVLSGDIERITALLVQLRQFGGHDPRAVRLGSDSPFHSPIMAPAKKFMQSVLSDTPINFPGLFPCISNVNSRPFASVADLKDLLARQTVETVNWWHSIKYVDQEMGVRRWIGLGPGKVGRNLVGKEVGMRGRDVVRGGGVWGVTDPKEIEVLLKGLEETEGGED